MKQQDLTVDGKPTLTAQALRDLARISITDVKGMHLVQRDKYSAFFKGYRFGKYLTTFSVVLTPTGKVKKGSAQVFEGY